VEYKCFDVAWSVRSVCLFVLTLISAKIAKLIEMLFAVLTDVNPRYHLLSGIHMGATWQI